MAQKKILIFLLLASSIPADKPDCVNRYHYKYRDEAAMSDKRNIAILAYGSLVNQRHNRQTCAQLASSEFAPTNIFFPISFSRHSHTGRITAVIDVLHGHPKRIYHARSSYQWLPNARNNVAAREGTPFCGQANGYDLHYIAYMKKIIPGSPIKAAELLIPGTHNWVTQKGDTIRSQLPDTILQQLAQWADDNGYSAIIWAALPANLENEFAAAKLLIENPILLESTKEYVLQLADGPQTEFERAVVAGKNALVQFACQKY